MDEAKEKPKNNKLREVHTRALLSFDEIQSAQHNERLQCLQDRRFVGIQGAQWEGKLGDQFENKPKIEVNKIQLSVMRIFSEYRNNRITVDFVSKDGEKNDKLADTLDGLYRSDEQYSDANEAYDNAFDEAVSGGIGAWRLRAEYEDEDDDENDKQRICIEPIYDADTSVYFDLNAKRQDKADARHCFILTAMTKKSYEEEYGDDVTTWNKDVNQTEYDWSTPDMVYVAEYYEIEKKKETIHIYKTLDGKEERYSDTDFKNDEGLEEQLLITAAEKIGEKKVKRKKVHKYILSGGKVLEDCGIIAGSCIPIIPMYGKRWFIDNIERCMGHVRLAKDAQRLKNMQLSKLAEISALSTVEKPILSPEQIAGHTTMWAEDNIKNYPYLLLNTLTDIDGNIIASGPSAYTKVPQIPPAMAALLQITEQDINDLLGNQQAGEQIVSNISGKAVELIQNRLDMQTYIYMSNMAKSIKRSGEVWLSMAKDLFVESGRKMKVVNKDYASDVVELNRPVLNIETQETEYENDLSKAKFDIVVDVGPSSSTKRSSTVASITALMQVTQDPETQSVLTAMAMMNMEGEGLSDARGYFRNKLVKMNVVKPTEEEMQKMQEQAENQQPDANTIYLQSAAENEQAKAAKSRADTVLVIEKASETEANTEKTKAETVEILAGIDRDDRKQFIETAEAINQVETI